MLGDMRRVVIIDHLGEDLSVERLADRAAMSVRNFSRTFAREVGVTSARLVERTRVEGARRLLEESTLPVDEVARTYLRALHVTPTEHRRRFRIHEETA